MKNLFIIFALLLSMSIFAQESGVGEDSNGDADASLCSEPKGEIESTTGTVESSTDESGTSNASEL